MKKIILILLLSMTSGLLYPNILNVPGSYSTIQLAINASVNGDTVLVQPGTYYENINFRGKKIVLTSKFYQSYDISFIHSTIINGSTPSQPDSASCVRITSGEDSTTVLQGFTITGGTGTKWTDEHGAGLYREGGGILIQYSSPVIKFNIIKDNIVTNVTGVTSTGGGGMRIGDSYPRIYNNVIMNNTGKYGAGVVLNYTGCEMKNNIVCVNYGSNQYGSGSGIWLNGSFTKPNIIENNTIVSNTAPTGSAGIYGFGSVQGTFRNNIIWGNVSSSSQQIQGGNFTVRYCNVQGGYIGLGNINIDPQFADTNYILSNNSPCADKGDSSVIYNDPADTANPTLATYPSRGTVRNDMGAYGGPGRKLLSNQVIGIHNNRNSVPLDLELYQNYPNPFNPSTVIEYYIPEYTKVNITVFDVLGRIVKILVDENQFAGFHSVRFEGTNISSGVFLYMMNTENSSKTRLMILQK